MFEKEKVENRKCEVCGIDCEKESMFSFTPPTCELEKVKKMFGRTEFWVCWCCLLKKMGFKK